VGGFGVLGDGCAVRVADGDGGCVPGAGDLRAAALAAGGELAGEKADAAALDDDPFGSALPVTPADGLRPVPLMLVPAAVRGPQ
jgi:hypothetical protein